MTAQHWAYFVAYRRDVHEALELLQQQEFAAGRFRGAEKKPADIDEAVESMEEQGTCSILDVTHVAGELSFGAVAPLSQRELVRCFGTAQPGHEMVETGTEFWKLLKPGYGVYIVVYKEGQPHELFFGGLPFD